MKQSKTIEREKNVMRECHHIWESWDYHLREKLEGADRIVKQMFKEMSYAGLPLQKAIEYVNPLFHQMIEDIGKEK